METSPAGGGWLELDGKLSFAIAEDDDSLDEDVSKGFTIEMWIYPRRVPKPDEAPQIIFSKVGSYQLYLIPRVQDPWGGKFGLQLARKDWKVASIAGSIIPPIADNFFNNWHHLAVVYYTKAGRFIRVFIDGQQVIGTFVPVMFDELLPQNTDSPLLIGGTDSFLASHFDGNIDDLRISGEAIYDNDIQTEPPMGILKIEKDTRALWYFEEGPSATSFKDSSGHDNTLIGHNGAKVVGGRFVKSSGKLSTAWGRIKGAY